MSGCFVFWQKTAYEMRISYWSSDVCASDHLILWITGIAFVLVDVMLVWFMIRYRARPGRKATYYHGNTRLEILWTSVIAVVVDRKSVVQGKIVSVRVDLGGRRIIKKQRTDNIVSKSCSVKNYHSLS